MAQSCIFNCKLPYIETCILDNFHLLGGTNRYLRSRQAPMQFPLPLRFVNHLIDHHLFVVHLSPALLEGLLYCLPPDQILTLQVPHLVVSHLLGENHR